MSLLDDLKTLGADVDTAVKRIRGDAELYQELVLDSVEDIKEYDVLECLVAGNIDEACSNDHALKGVMGNLGLTPLYKMYSELNMLLKDNKVDESRKLMNRLIPVQNDFIECMEKYID